MPRGDNCWIEWAEELREQMMAQGVQEIDKSTDDIHRESGTQESLSKLQSRGFWNACQRGDPAWDALARAGFSLRFDPNDDGR